MRSDRRFLWLIWLFRILMLFGTLGGVIVVYLRTFMEPDIMESWVWSMSALIGGSVFLSSFPLLRIHIRVSQLKKLLSEDPDVTNTLTKVESTKNDARYKIIFISFLIIVIVFIVFNFVRGKTAYLNGSNLEMFLHMVFIIATILMFNTILLVYFIDEQFKELIHQYKKDQSSEEKETMGN